MTIGHLTIENLSKLFHNNFELALKAIKIAQLMIRSGQEVTPRKLLDELARHPEHFDVEKMEELLRIKEENDEQKD